MGTPFDMPHVLVVRPEAPPSYPGSVIATHGPLRAIAPSTPPPGLVVASEAPPVELGRAIAPKAPLATPLLSSRVYVAMAESPPSYPGSVATSVVLAQPPRPAPGPVVAFAESPFMARGDPACPVRITTYDRAV